MKFKPLRENVLLRRLEAAEEKIGSIIVPDTAKEKPMTAEVVEVGAGKVLKDGARQAPEVKPGQTVLIGKYSGSEVKLDGEDYIIVREDEILGIVE
ncbi:MAG: co-chaperone GroES [Acidobacteria bacterium]|nr:co-chaperone GroES [Acidobacteriota bacterium]MYA46780.1 co-chaperone GroES [Acidobacteriota bacterium]MYI37582.1 co-chaperone GroES [Acidobacteriota bacterium]